MKRILYKKRQSNKHHRKMICINEHSEDKECRTTVRKSFVYKVTQAMNEATQTNAPEIYITKALDSKLKREKFSFRVKGEFFMSQGRGIFKVDFCHTLKIDIDWKNKIFSPNKSVTLT